MRLVTSFSSPILTLLMALSCSIKVVIKQYVNTLVSSSLLGIEDLLDSSSSPVIIVPNGNTQDSAGSDVAPGSCSKGLVGCCSSRHVEDHTRSEAEKVRIYTQS